MFLSEYITVARKQVKASEATCIDCGQHFGRHNIFTKDGLAEVAISGMCEACFDALFEDCDD